MTATVNIAPKAGRLTDQALQGLFSTCHLQPKIKLALRLHLVEGLDVTKACARAGVSRSGFYRARDSLWGRREALTRRVTFEVPEAIADAFIEGGNKQLAKYAALQAQQLAEYDRQAQAQLGGTVPTVGTDNGQ